MGNVVVIGSGLLVSNNATLDVQSDVVETDKGKAVKTKKVVEILDPYGECSINEQVEYAFREDDTKTSGKGIVITRSEIKVVIDIEKELDNYQQIIRRGKEWQV